MDKESNISIDRSFEVKMNKIEFLDDKIINKLDQINSIRKK